MVKEKLNLVAFRRMFHFLFQKDFWRVNPMLRTFHGYERIIEIQKYLITHDCRFVHETYQSMILYKNCFVTTQFQNVGYINDFEEGQVPEGFSFALHRLGPHGVKNSTFLLNHNKTLRYCFHCMMEYHDKKREHQRVKSSINAFLKKEKIEDFATDFYAKWFSQLSFGNYFDLVRATRKKSTKIGCFHCGKIFDSKKVKVKSYSTTGLSIPSTEIEWTNDVVPTAVCPFCHIDSIICESEDMPKLKITSKLLGKLKEKCFSEESSYAVESEGN